MPERFIEAIIKHLSDRSYNPIKPRQLARQMGIEESQYDAFRQAVKVLRDGGRVVLGAGNAVTLPDMPRKLTGYFRLNERGFGFIVPDTPNSHGDLFVPPEGVAGALSGDLVEAVVADRGKRDGRNMYAGRIIRIIQRGRGRYVGQLDCAGGKWFIMPEGSGLNTPILLTDVSAAAPSKGSKVVVEIVKYGDAGQWPTGVIVESLGVGGQLAIETLAVIRAHDIEDKFPEDALAETRKVVAEFDENDKAGRVDLTGMTIVTIDPPDARDYDDAISLVGVGGGKVELGIHIADVSHFVRVGGALDNMARARSTSVYFPRKVVPMLPEILSNGVCSLQEGVNRYCLSAFITYDANATIISTRFAETVIRSARRLTYVQAQEVIDGKAEISPQIDPLLRGMNSLARRIESRRRAAGMIHLDLPEIELKFDDAGKVIGAEPTDNSYTHKMIEMFMVEANDAVAELMHRIGQPCLRRIHPAPDSTSSTELSAFVRACGHKLPNKLSRSDIQQLLEKVKGRPESYAVNLATLKTFEQAEYSPQIVGHYALASEHYLHFTSPIRRYPDLTVHRLLRANCRGTLPQDLTGQVGPLIQLAEHCSQMERRAKSAEDELREVLVLQYLEGKIGEDYDGVITGVTNFGMFVQYPQFMIEGLVRLESLGDDWWDVDAKLGVVRGQRSGRRYRMGDVLKVRIASVDVARRRMDLELANAPQKQGKGGGRQQDKNRSGAGRQEKNRGKKHKGQKLTAVKHAHGAGHGKKTARKEKHRPGGKKRRRR